MVQWRGVADLRLLPAQWAMFGRDACVHVTPLDHHVSNGPRKLFFQNHSLPIDVLPPH